MASTASVPGMTVESKDLVRRGVIALAVVLAVALIGWGINYLAKPDQIRMTLLSTGVAPGVSSGTAVEMNGVQIGKVDGIDQEGSGRLGVQMTLDVDKIDGLTDGLLADFAPNNLFGITSVQITPSSAGKPLRDGARILPATAPADSTMSALLRSLADVEGTALRPYMSELIRQSDTASKGFLPMIRALGAVAQANAETQTVPTSKTLPILADLLQGVGASTGDILAAIKLLWDWPAPGVPGYPEAQTATIATLVNTTEPLLAELVKNLQPLTPVLGSVVDLERRVVSSAPGAAENGRQISDLIEALRRAIKDTPNGKVLNLDVQARPVPVPPAQGGGR